MVRKGSTYKRTFLVEAQARSKSFTTALAAMRYVVEYGRACDDEGRTLNVEEYKQHVGVSLAQAYRRRAAFATCFPSQTVESVWAIVKPLLDESNFKNEHARAQAVFASTIVATWNVP
jgi:hypothetical protein